MICWFYRSICCCSIVLYDMKCRLGRDGNYDMFIQSGGSVEKGDRWIHYINSVEEWQRPYIEAVREEIIRKGIKWTGKEMQDNPNGTPVFNNGKLGMFTWRAWGI